VAPALTWFVNKLAEGVNGLEQLGRRIGAIDARNTADQVEKIVRQMNDLNAEVANLEKFKGQGWFRSAEDDQKRIVMLKQKLTELGAERDRLTAKEKQEKTPHAG